MKKSLPNPCEESSDDARLNINTDAALYRDLFHRLFAGEHGIKAAIVNTLLVALYNECKEQQLPFQCEPENINKFKTILKNVNFKPTTATAGCGCTADSSAVCLKQPDAGDNDRGGTDDPSRAAQKPRHERAGSRSRTSQGSKTKNNQNKKEIVAR